MAEEEKVETTEVKKEKGKSILRENLEALSEPDNFQKYVLGTKKNGAPRALYDVLKDYTSGSKGKKKKKKGKKKHGNSTYALYLTTKKHKKKKKRNHWHIDD